MRALGFDPGLAACGLAVVQLRERPEILAARTVRTDPALGLERRFELIWRSAWELIAEARPQVVGVEEQRGAFLGYQARGGKTNADSLRTFEAVGLARGLAYAWGIPVHVIEPRSIKLAVIGPGGGSADKRQVRRAIESLCVFGASGMGASKRLSEHACDAIAIAIAAARRHQLSRSVTIKSFESR